MVFCMPSWRGGDNIVIVLFVLVAAPVCAWGRISAQAGYVKLLVGWLLSWRNGRLLLSSREGDQ